MVDYFQRATVDFLTSIFQSFFGVLSSPITIVEISTAKYSHVFNAFSMSKNLPAG